MDLSLRRPFIRTCGGDERLEPDHKSAEDEGRPIARHHRVAAKVQSINNFETLSRVFTQVYGNHSYTKRLPAISATTRPLAGRGRENPMFKIPAYDPFAIAVMGLGILLAAAFAYPL